MNKLLSANQKNFPIENERAPSYYAEVTPAMRGGEMEKKVQKRTNKTS